MTSDQLYQMVEDFEIPHTAAFAYIFLDTKSEANILLGHLRTKNYKTLYHLTNGYHEVRFWGNKK